MEIDDAGRKRQGVWVRTKWWMPRFRRNQGIKLDDEDDGA